MTPPDPAWLGGGYAAHVAPRIIPVWAKAGAPSAITNRVATALLRDKVPALDDFDHCILWYLFLFFMLMVNVEMFFLFLFFFSVAFFLSFFLLPTLGRFSGSISVQYICATMYDFDMYYKQADDAIWPVSYRTSIEFPFIQIKTLYLEFKADIEQHKLKEILRTPLT